MLSDLVSHSFFIFVFTTLQRKWSLVSLSN
jgi:hypothetical protein